VSWLRTFLERLRGTRSGTLQPQVEPELTVPAVDRHQGAAPGAGMEKDSAKVRQSIAALEAIKDQAVALIETAGSHRQAANPIWAAHFKEAYYMMVAAWPASAPHQPTRSIRSFGPDDWLGKETLKGLWSCPCGSSRRAREWGNRIERGRPRAGTGSSG